MALTFPDPTITNPWIDGNGDTWFYSNKVWTNISQSAVNCTPVSLSYLPTSLTEDVSTDVVITGANFINGLTELTGTADLVLNSIVIDSLTQITVNATIASGVAPQTITIENVDVGSLGDAVSITSVA